MSSTGPPITLAVRVANHEKILAAILVVGAVYALALMDGAHGTMTWGELAMGFGFFIVVVTIITAAVVLRGERPRHWWCENCGHAILRSNALCRCPICSHWRFFNAANRKPHCADCAEEVRSL